MAQKFYDSVYRYSDPIRYFKANDPYYFEVDNIPLKQLQENCNFLKDQVGQLNASKDNALNRSSFSELKPFVYDIDNIVYVSSGRYTARINDAYSVNKLQILNQIAGFSAGEFNAYEYGTNVNPYLIDALNKFKSSLAQDALGANGLSERVFVYPTRDSNYRSQYQNYPGTTPGMSWNFASQYWPNVFGVLHEYGVADSQITTGGSLYNEFGSPNSPVGFAYLPAWESVFVKRWRGIARTSIVDVPDVLTLEVPPFDPDDFFYIDRNGNRISLAVSATQRIDLLFIYSKPVDVSSTTISKFVNNQPVTINTPTLGLLKGAGIGMNFRSQTTSNPIGPTGEPGTRSSYVKTVDSDGNPLMLPSLGDLNNTFMGFSGIRGSFPSPDDLLNISPLLAETLEYDNISLIGQSILPIAYIVVKKDAQINVLGSPILTSQDIIDIRPFFRTTELTYSERTGIAAAVPQISLANPVASENYVDHVAKELSDRINILTGGSGGGGGTIFETFPRIVRSGYILGGRNFGPESVLADYIRKNNPVGAFTSESQLEQAVRNTFDYPNGKNLQRLPDWDFAGWKETNLNAPYVGNISACDYINFTTSRSVGAFNTYNPISPRLNKASYGYGNPTNNRNLRYDGVSSTSFASSLTYPGLNSYPNLTPVIGGVPTNVAGGGFYSICYVKKTLRITKPSWARDIRVDAKLINCVPLCQTSLYAGGASPAFATDSKTSNIWISKKRVPGSSTQVDVTIFVSWAIDLYSEFSSNPRLMSPSLNRDRTFYYNGFAVITNDMSRETDSDNGPTFETAFNQANPNPAAYPNSVFAGSVMGICLYPSVYFDVIAIPDGYGVETDYGLNPIITL